MVLYYIKIALRNIRKQRLYAAINIGGFAIGIAACLLIALYIRHEMSYDKANPNKNRLYRLVGEVIDNGVAHRGISFPAPTAKALKNDFPEIEQAGRTMSNTLFGGAKNQVRRSDEVNDNYEEGFCFADSTVPDLLNMHMVYGNRSTALSSPGSIIINKSMADKYYPGKNPVGQTMVFNDNTRMTITVGGVMEDMPANTHFQYRGLISLSGNSFWEGEQETWDASNYGVYLLLKPGVNIAAFEKKMTSDIVYKYMIPSMKAKGRTNAEASFKNARIYLQPVADAHLQSTGIEQDDVKHGDMRFIWLFAAIAGFILLMACINFLNLSTARSANRAKEVGLRKVIGSNRAGLIRQFLTESTVYSFFSFTTGLLLAYMALPVFNRIADTQLFLPWNEWWFVPVLLAAAAIIGFIAGIYPAFYLSHFKPVAVLKGGLSTGAKNSGLRSTLVVFQFTVSVLLLIGTSVIYKQMRYILNSNAGFDKDQVVMLQGTNVLRGETDAFRNELMQLFTVKNVSVSDFLPITGTKRNGNTFWKEGRANEDAGAVGQYWIIDANYLSTFGIKLVAGRNFSKDMGTDAKTAIINQTMVNKLALTDPVGKMITNGGDHFRVIGVVNNFYFSSMKQEVEPLCMVLGNSNSVISVKIAGANMKEALASIDATWKKFIPHQTLRYEFMDQRYAAMYADVQRSGMIFTGFSILAIVIACLGLFALAAFMAEQRSKEVSIRKVLGASVANLFLLLTGNFLKLVLISLLIAIPLGWWLVNKWIEDFVYRTHIGWEIFAIAGATVLLIALATICWQAIKAAIANPIKSLRNE